MWETLRWMPRQEDYSTRYWKNWRRVKTRRPQFMLLIKNPFSEYFNSNLESPTNAWSVIRFFRLTCGNPWRLFSAITRADKTQNLRASPETHKFLPFPPKAVTHHVQHSLTAPTSPLGSWGVHAQNFVTIERKWKGSGLDKEIERKKVIKVFSKNRIKLTTQQGHKPLFLSSLIGKVLYIVMSNETDLHPDDYISGLSGRITPDSCWSRH